MISTNNKSLVKWAEEAALKAEKKRI